jgi:hypothetical protein
MFCLPIIPVAILKDSKSAALVPIPEKQAQISQLSGLHTAYILPRLNFVNTPLR